MRRQILSALAIPLILGACSTVVDTASRTAGNIIGEEVGRRIGTALVGALPDTWGPDIQQLYVSHLLSVAFYSGAYVPENVAYEPGEWTRWRVGEGASAEGNEVTRAFLEREPDGQEWWRVSLADAQRDSLVVEALFSADRTEIRRMRMKTPEDASLQEVPVQEGTYAWSRPVELTEESIEGATVGVERVDVPAGTFEARHVRYQGAGSGAMEWWLHDDVPGNMVMYRGSSQGEGWVAELQAYGDDASR